MTNERLAYAGRGQIVRESDGKLVSPRNVVAAWNGLLDVMDDFQRMLNEALDWLAARGIEVGDGK